MSKIYRIELDSNDLGQALDGLESRADAWERTARYLLGVELPGDQDFLVEECHKVEEATGIAEHYRSIIQQIRTQMKEQS